MREDLKTFACFFGLIALLLTGGVWARHLGEKLPAAALGIAATVLALASLCVIRSIARRNEPVAKVAFVLLFASVTAGLLLR